MSEDRRRLSDAEIGSALQGLPGWSLLAGKLHREFKFRDFVEAVGFMTSAALVIQGMDHHPEWSNVYGTVRVDLVTHSASGVTATDVKLATKLNELADRLKPA
ncbi:MAG TPA: 4a-hydroxytetrahydrobiopterin dehydratase [Candidatus Eisenbacteria bacterium]